MLPQGYKIPTNSGSYMKFQDGANRLHVLGKAIVGWEYWNIEGKPVRSKEVFNEVPADIRVNKDGTTERIKHFWAFPVWNYSDKKLQVLEITQSSIQGGMKIKIDNRRGDVSKFDFIITKTGEGLGTDYDVDVDTHEEIPNEAELKDKAEKINLEALYKGEDPFKGEGTPDNRIPVTPAEIDDSDIPF